MLIKYCDFNGSKHDQFVTKEFLIDKMCFKVG